MRRDITNINGRKTTWQGVTRKPYQAVEPARGDNYRPIRATLEAPLHVPYRVSQPEAVGHRECRWPRARVRMQLDETGPSFVCLLDDLTPHRVIQLDEIPKLRFEILFSEVPCVFGVKDVGRCTWIFDEGAVQECRLFFRRITR